MALRYTDWRFIVKLYNSGVREVFPSECVACHKEGPWLCSDCLQTCTKIQTPTCPFCNKLSSRGTTCSACRKTFSLTGGRSIWYYDGAIPPLIHALKYDGITSSLDFLHPWLSGVAQTMQLPPANLVITSVPSTQSRLERRGFNQSELLAQAVAQSLQRPYLPLLTRTNETRSQTTLTRQERLANVAEQFQAKRTLLPEEKIILIVDDVITTGATLSSCASALRSAGAKQVWSLTLAKD